MRRSHHPLWAALLLASSAAGAAPLARPPAPRLAVLGFGDCDSPRLPELTRALRAEVAAFAGESLLDEEATLRPAGGPARRSLDEVRRALDAARTDFLNLEVDRAERLLLATLPEIDRLPLGAPRWEAWTGARVTLARLYLFANKRPRASGLLVDILKVQEDFELNRVEHPPSMRELLEVARSVLAGLPRFELRVETPTPGATVYLDGYPVGATPLVHRMVGGTYTLLVASEEGESFVRSVHLGSDTRLQVDLDRESRFRAAAGPCFAAVNREERLGSMALLGGALGVERLVAVRLQALAGESYLAAALLDVSTGQELREGRVRLEPAVPPPLEKLARFALTGETSPELGAPAQAVRPPAAPHAGGREPEAAPGRGARWAAWGLAGVAVGLSGLALYGHLRSAQLEGELGRLVVPGSAGLIRAEDFGRKEQLARQAATARTVRLLAGAGAGASALGWLGLALWPRPPGPSDRAARGPVVMLWASGAL